MRKAIFIVGFLLALHIHAQDCEALAPMKPGIEMEYTHYNKKGKPEMISRRKVTSVDDENGFLVIGLEANYENLKGKERKDMPTISHVLKCKEGNYYVSMNGYFPTGQQQSGMELSVEGDFLTFPDQLTPGQTLDDGEISVSLGAGATSLIKATMKVLNRKALQQTSFTTPAGTFDGVIVTFDYEFKMGFIKMRGSGKEWYVKGIGVVRSESYNKKGKLIEWFQLTKFNN